MVKCKDGSIYTGISNDVEDRIKEHNSGQGGKYTASKRPVRLIFQEEQTDKSSALKREGQIKNWGRVKKEALSRFGSARFDSLALSPPRAEPFEFGAGNYLDRKPIVRLHLGDGRSILALANV